MGVGAPPLPVHAKRVCRLLRKHSQAAKPLNPPPFGGYKSGFSLKIRKIQERRSHKDAEYVLEKESYAYPSAGRAQ